MERIFNNNTRTRVILHFCAHPKKQSVKQIQAGTGVNIVTLRNQLDALCYLGVLKRQKTIRRNTYAYWSALSPQVNALVLELNAIFNGGDKK